MSEFRTILGINFFTGSLSSLVERSRKGGLIVVPAAPALADLRKNREYRQALENAAFAITDSGFLVLLWFLRKGEFLTRISGLKYLRGLLEDPNFRRANATFWVMASPDDMAASLRLLNSKGLPVTEAHCHIAPHYPKNRVEDEVLLAKIEARRSDYVVINIGGGTQEVLGSFLSKRLSYRPAIICTGAALAFMSGRQANIPPWADKLMLGWLARCISEPGKFIPRYLKGFRLVGILFRYGKRPISETGAPA